MRIDLLKKLNLDNTFEVNQISISRVLLDKPNQIIFTLPINGVEKTLELETNNFFSNGFKITNEFGQVLNLDMGVHYKGKVLGNSNSVVTLTFSDDGIEGMIHETDNKFDVIKLNGLTYTLTPLTEIYDFNCQSIDTGIVDDVYTNSNSNYQSLPKGLNPYVTNVANYCVKSFWEVDYDIFSLKGASTASYITSLFNASSTLFSNDGIYVSLSELKIWTSGYSIYRTYGVSVSYCNCNQVLYNYRDYYVNNSITFNGDFAHLLTYNYPCTGSTSSGDRCGVSWINGLCNNIYKFTFSQLYYTTSTPSSTLYSWNVNVVTHEQGHQFGSQHTHACVWNGNNTAIDGCVPTVGGCPNPGLPPVGGGTIMSYCHLNPSVGINFANGFGPQPQQKIVSSLNSKTCLLPCGPLPTPQPTSTPTLTPGLSPPVTPTPTITKTPTVTSNWDCKVTTRFSPPLSGNSVNISGVTFTSTYSGSVKSPFFWGPDCISNSPLINGPELGDLGLPYSYTLISDTTLSMLKVRIGNIRTSQVMTLMVNSGITSLSLCQGCCVSISGNTLTAQSCTFTSNGAGVNIIITSTSPFTSLTISGVNPLPSSSFGVFFDFIDFVPFGILPTQTPTQTKTPTKTINISPTMTSTPTITPTKTQTPVSTSTPTPTLTTNFCEQYGCNTPIRPPMTVNGISITSSIIGSIVNMPNTYSSCNGSVITPPNINIFGLNSNFVYSLNFSTPIYGIVMYITGAGLQDIDCTETFTVSTNTGNPSIFSPINCFTLINNNVITINTGGLPAIGGGGGKFLIYNSTPFTSVSVAGFQVCSGSYIVFCGDSLICPEFIPTPTPTITQTITKTVTKTQTPTNTNFSVVPKVDFVCVHWYEGVNSSQFINKMTDIINLYNKPIWVTEFAPQTISSSQSQPNLYTQQEVNDFINTVVPWMNSNPMVERYAWNDSKIGTSAIFTIDGQLTETGITYRDAQ